MAKNKKDENLLDYVPNKSKKVVYNKKENGLIEIIMPRDSIIERIIRKLFFTPDKYRVELDKMGTFVWEQIDGQRTIYEIAGLVQEHFKEEAEPLYERLLQYINILKNNNFITFDR
ncbi:PqqD family protein [Tissierella simiarum]|uniref:PqqD family protein n=1 Tax=Tissierella simiarum TaxID=2841534 RepID=UPI0031BA626C